MGKLVGKVAIVTGAAMGMGEAQVRLFAHEGAKVVLADIHSDGRRVANEIGIDALFVQHDVTSETSWNNLVKLAQERFGSIDILVNTAGIGGFAMIEDTTLEDFDQMFRINTLGVFLGMRAVIGPMADAGGGAIVNIGSASAFKGNPGLGAYTATKWAVRGMTKSAANELARFNIRVNAIHPGPTATPMMQRNVADPSKLNINLLSGRVGTPEEIAAATLFLVSSDSSYVWGVDLPVDGGHLIRKPWFPEVRN